MKIDNPLGDFWSLRPNMNESKKNSDNAEKADSSAGTAAGASSDSEGAGKADAIAGRVTTPAGDTYETSRPKDTPPIREQKVEQARRKMEEGAYDTQEVRDAIVARLVDALTG